jgi:hypothetical protein
MLGVRLQPDTSAAAGVGLKSDTGTPMLGVRLQSDTCAAPHAAADYSGMFPCLRFGAGSRFGSVASSARIR